MRSFVNKKEKKKIITPAKAALTALLPAMLLLNYLSSRHPVLTEKYYSSSVYPVLSLIVNKISSVYPFSLMEIVILLIIVSMIFFTVKLALMLKRHEFTAYHFKKYAVNAVCIASCIYTAFCFLCGFNYNRLTFSQLAGYKVEKSSVETLYNMCTELADEAKELREELNQNGKVFSLTESSLKTASRAAEHYDALNAEYPFLTKGYSAPKPVICSEIMSYLDITGVIFPYTMEANVNVASPDFMIPSTMCHELSHVRGFMREDEANFIAYLVCRSSDDIEFKYSGTMLALIYSANALYSADTELFKTLVNERYSNDMLRDLQDNSIYWKEHKSFLSEVSNTVNNSYLKINRQQDGVRSYGRMVDLLLAEYKKENPQ